MPTSRGRRSDPADPHRFFPTPTVSEPVAAAPPRWHDPWDDDYRRRTASVPNASISPLSFDDSDDSDRRRGRRGSVPVRQRGRSSAYEPPLSPPGESRRGRSAHDYHRGRTSWAYDDDDDVYRHSSSSSSSRRARSMSSPHHSSSSKSSLSSDSSRHRSDRDKDRDRRDKSERGGPRCYPPSSSRSHKVKSGSPSTSTKQTSNTSIGGRGGAADDIIMGAARCAIQAGTIAAFKMRNDTSPWIGPKGAKVAAAALGAAIVDSFMDHRHPDHKGGVRHKVLGHAAEMAIGNLVMKPASKKMSH